MLRRNARILPILLAALTLVGCGDAAVRMSRDQKSVAPVYDVRDDPKVRTQVRYLDALRIASDRLRGGEFDEAERQAKAAMKLDARQPDAYTVLAMVANGRGQGEKAGELYRKAADMAPTRADVLSNYGAWLCSNGHEPESLVWFDRALADRSHADPSGTLANAGGCALEAGQRERAERDLRRALELDPANAYALESMARNEFALGRFFEARAFSQRRLAAARATASVLQLASQIEVRLGDTKAASRYLQRIREEFPQDATENPRG